MRDHTTAAGLRRATPAGSRATRLADGYAGLPEGVTRWRLAAALRAAARPMGLTGPMLRLLEHYIDLTYDQDWEAGGEPVVTRPLVEIADHLGRSERQVRNIERALAERGLLAWRDSGNHHRKGRRDHRTGRLVYAYGPSLAPLGARATEIIAQAEAARAELAMARRQRIAISALRRRIRAALAAAPAGAASVADAFAAQPDRMPAGLSLAALAARRDALAAIARDADAFVTDAPVAEHDREASAPAPAPAQRQARSASDGCRGEIAALPAVSGRRTTDTSHNHSMNGSCMASGPRGDGHGAQTVPMPLALAAAGPELQAALAAIDSGTPRWPAIAQAAQSISILLGIDHDLWAEACRRLGRNGAALAILIIERGAAPPAGTPAIRRPPAYLRGMLARADAGALRLDRSVRAWAQRGPT